MRRRSKWPTSLKPATSVTSNVTDLSVIWRRSNLRHPMTSRNSTINSKNSTKWLTTSASNVRHTCRRWHRKPPRHPTKPLQTKKPKSKRNSKSQSHNQPSFKSTTTRLIIKTLLIS
eukprot:PhF_6_TR30139/c4_g1_i1/m.44095